MSAPLKIVVEERGSGKASFDIAALGVRAEDVMPVWPALDEIFHEDEKRRFEQSGPGWAKLAQATVDKKAALGTDPRLMRDSGELYASLTRSAVGLAESMPTHLVFGTDDPSARFHQYGTVNMPKREVVGISPAARRAMVRVLTAFVRHGAV